MLAVQDALSNLVQNSLSVFLGLEDSQTPPSQLRVLELEAKAKAGIFFCYKNLCYGRRFQTLVVKDNNPLHHLVAVHHHAHERLSVFYKLSQLPRSRMYYCSISPFSNMSARGIGTET